MSRNKAFRRAHHLVAGPVIPGGRPLIDAEGVTPLKARRPERFRERSTVEARVAVAQDPGPDIREVSATLSQGERDVVRLICERQVASGPH